LAVHGPIQTMDRQRRTATPQSLNQVDDGACAAVDGTNGHARITAARMGSRDSRPNRVPASPGCAQLAVVVDTRLLGPHRLLGVGVLKSSPWIPSTCLIARHAWTPCWREPDTGDAIGNDLPGKRKLAVEASMELDSR
jgi:hypothetical protein